MDESAPAHVRRPWARRVLLFNEVLATLLIEAILVVIGLALLSSLVPSAAGPRSDLNEASTMVLAITPGSRRFALTIADLDAISRSIPDTAVLSRVVSGTAPVGTSTQAAQTRVLGVDPAYAVLPRGSLSSGTFFTSQDAAAANRVAIIGQTLATRLFPNGRSSVSQTIRIRNQPFTVLGVLAGQGNATADNTDDAILIPFQTSQIRLFGATAIDEVLLGSLDVGQIDPARQHIEDVLRQRHRVSSGQPADFTVLIAPSTAQAGGTVAQLVDRVLQFSRQYGCAAKALCGPPRNRLGS